MKKYEAPIVELTKFDVEDVITASAVAPIDVTGLSGDALNAAVADIKGVAAANGLTDVFSW